MSSMETASCVDNQQAALLSALWQLVVTPTLLDLG